MQHLIQELKSRKISNQTDTEVSQRMIKELEDCDIKQGQPVWHQTYGLSLITNMQLGNQPSERFDGNAFIEVTIVHTCTTEHNSPIIVALSELLPYNKSTRALYE